MGRVWSRQIVAIRCETRTCKEEDPIFPPMPQEATWHDLVPQLTSMIARGWAVVLTQKIRTYCPDHATRARACTCVTNPARRHLCVAHGADASALVWDSNQTPVEVSPFLKAV